MEFTESTGNVFEDLGFQDYEEALAKAKLAHEIYLIIKKQGLTQANAAKLLKTSQPRISALMRGHLSGFSIEKLLHFLILLGNDRCTPLLKGRCYNL
ncbi:MAG: helix-turn-helix domain-containing protein [Chlamydiota bacterium]